MHVAVKIDGTPLIIKGVRHIDRKGDNVVIYPKNADIIKSACIETDRKLERNPIRYLDYIFSHPKYGKWLRYYDMTRQDISKLYENHLAYFDDGLSSRRTQRHQELTPEELTPEEYMQMLFNDKTWAAAGALGLEVTKDQIISIN